MKPVLFSYLITGELLMLYGLTAQPLEAVRRECIRKMKRVPSPVFMFIATMMAIVIWPYWILRAVR
jgi:hypothetical protein